MKKHEWYVARDGSYTCYMYLPTANLLKTYDSVGWRGTGTANIGFTGWEPCSLLEIVLFTGTDGP